MSNPIDSSNLPANSLQNLEPQPTAGWLRRGLGSIRSLPHQAGGAVFQLASRVTRASLGAISSAASASLGAISSAGSASLSVISSTAGAVLAPVGNMALGPLLTTVQYLKVNSPPGTTTPLRKVMAIGVACLRAPSNSQLFALGVPVQGPSRPRPNPANLDSNALLGSYNDTQRLLVEALNKLGLRETGFQEPAVPPHTLEQSGESAPVQANSESYTTLAQRIKDMTALKLLDSRLDIEGIKRLTLKQNPLEFYFSTLNLFPWLRAKIFYFFMKPILNNIFDLKTVNNPGLILQLISLLRTSLRDSFYHQGVIAFFLGDLMKITKDSSTSLEMNADDLNNRLVSWLEKNISIKTGWPFIGSFVDRIINREIFQAVRTHNIPAILRDTLNLTRTPLNTIDPLKIAILRWIQQQTAQSLESLKASYGEQLNASLAGQESSNDPSLSPLEISAIEPPLELRGVDGKVLNLKSIITAFTQSNAQSAVSERSAEVNPKRFRLHFAAGLASPVEKEQYQALLAYETELNSFLQAVKADTQRDSRGNLEEVLIGDRIEAEADQVLEDILNNGLKAIVSGLSQEATREHILQKAFNLVDTLITAPLVTPAALQREFTQITNTLASEVKEIISETLKFQFHPSTQKRIHEAPNRYAVACIARLKQKIETTTQAIIRSLDLSGAAISLSTSEGIHAYQEILLGAENLFSELLRTYQENLTIIYDENAGAFTEDEKRGLMAFISSRVSSISTLTDLLSTLRSKTLPSIDTLIKNRVALQGNVLPSNPQNLFQGEAISHFQELSQALLPLEKELLKEETLLSSLRQRPAAAGDAATPLTIQSCQTRCEELEAQISTAKEPLQALIQSECEKQALLIDQGVSQVTPLIQNALAQLLESIRPQQLQLLHKELIVAVETLPELLHDRLMPLLNSYLSFLGKGTQEFLKNPLNLRYLATAQLERLRENLPKS